MNPAMVNVVERFFSGATRFRRLVKGDVRLPATVVGLNFVAFACQMLTRVFAALQVQNTVQIGIAPSR